MADGKGITPLAICQALGLGCPFQAVTNVADKLGHIIQVELVALRQAIRWISRVTAGYGCREKAEMLASPPLLCG